MDIKKVTTILQEWFNGVLVTRGNEHPEERIPLYKPECEACADGFISAHEKATTEIRAIKDAEIDTEHTRLVEVARSAGRADGYKKGLVECQDRMEKIKSDLLAILKEADDLRTLERLLVDYVSQMLKEIK